MRGARDVFTPINESSWSFGKIWVGPVKKPIIIWAADEDVGGELDKISNHHWNDWTPIPYKANEEAFFSIRFILQRLLKAKVWMRPISGKFWEVWIQRLAGWLVGWCVLTFTEIFLSHKVGTSSGSRWGLLFLHQRKVISSSTNSYEIRFNN